MERAPERIALQSWFVAFMQAHNELDQDKYYSIMQSHLDKEEYAKKILGIPYTDKELGIYTRLNTAVYNLSEAVGEVCECIALIR